VASVADLVVRITADTQRAVAGVKDVEKSTGRMAGGLKSAALPAAAALAGIGLAAMKSVDAASAVQQAYGALDSIFGKNAGQMKAWADGAAESTGLAASEYAELASVIGAQLKNAGTPMEELGGKTDALIRQGADMAAMFGGTTAEAVAALSSALKGETDPIERYGVAVKQADIAARMAADGTDKLTGAAAKQAQTTALLALVNEQTADSVGTFAAEQDSAAGSAQIAAAQMENLQASMGQALLPVVAMLSTSLGLLAGFATKNTKTFQILVGVVAALSAAILVANAALKVHAVVTGVAEAVTASYTKKGIAFKVAELARAAATGIATAATTIAAVAVRALGIAIAFATGPVGLIIAAIALFVAGIVLLYKKNESFAAFVDGAWAAISGAVSGAVDKIVSLMRALPDTIRAAFSGAATWLTGAGRAIVEGLGAGIEAAKAWLMGKVQAIADSIPGWLKKRLGIASPSKVTALIGRQVMQGLEAGMADGVAGVKAMVEKVAATVSETMAARFKSDKRAAKAARQVMASIEDETEALTRNARKRQAVYADLAKAREDLTKVQDERKSYAEGITNAAAAFGAITNLADKEATTADAILADMRARVEKVGHFQAVLAGLAAGGLSQNTIAAMAAAGVEGGLAVAEGLAAGGPAAIAEANALQAQLDTSAATLGTDTATTMYAAGEQSAQALVDGLVLDQERLDKRAKELAEQMAKAIKKALRQALKKGTGGGGGDGNGNGSGTLSLVPALAAQSVAPAVPTATGRAASTAAAPGPTIIVNGAVDPEATARQIRRILAGHDRRMGLAG